MNYQKIGFLTRDLWEMLSNEAKINIATTLFKGKTQEVPNMGGSFETVTFGEFKEIQSGDKYQRLYFEDTRSDIPIKFFDWEIINQWNFSLIESIENVIKKSVTKLYFKWFIKGREFCGQ